MLTARQNELVKATIPALRARGESIASRFYAEMLEAHPEIRHMFNADDQKSGAQARRLAAAVLTYASNIEHLDKLTKAVDQIVASHVRVHVRPEQYPIVGKHLLAAIRGALGEAATPETLDAWTAAFRQLADVLIAREKQLYATGKAT